MSGRLRFLSLCSGIGGIDLAAEWAGMEIVGQVEIDPYCRRVLAKHWPDVKRVSDIRSVWGNDFGSVDVVAGGIPCQPFSVAGKRRGATDDRYLWPEMLRIVQIYQPAWVLVENVAGFVGMALDRVLADLDAAGYEARAFVLPAAAVGAPHLRERCFVVAHTRSTGAGLAAHHSSGQNRPAANAPSPALVRRHDGPRGAEGLDAGGGEDVAHANQHGRGWQERARAGDVGGSSRADARDEGHPQRHPAECCSEDVAHTARITQRGATDEAHAFAGSRKARAVLVGGSQRRQPDARQAQPDVGGEPDGLSRRLDGRIGHSIEPAPRHPWPVGPGEPQAPWEAPRTVTGTVPDRAARLKALGNAVVPQQVYPILAAMVAASETTE